MHGSHTKQFAWLLALAGVLAVGYGLAPAAEAPYAGKWKATIHLPAQSLTLWIIEIEDKAGKPAAKVLASADPNLKDAQVESINVDDKSIHLDLKASAQGNTIEFALAAYFPKDGAKAKNFLGSVAFNNQRQFAELERTDAKELDAKNAGVPPPGIAEARKAMQVTDAKERQAALKQFLEKNPGGALAYALRVTLLNAGIKEGAAEADLRGHADKLIEAAAAHGPEMKLTALQTVTQLLAPSDKLPALALNYAQQAEKELDKSSTPAQQVSVLKVLASALRKNGKTTEAKELKGRIAKLDVRLDEEFARNAVPFKPEPARRKGDSNRVVLLELFTGVRCPPCVAADAAFDALLQAHKPADVVMLQYHMHIPGPDPLTNKDAEERFQFYHLEGTPSALIDGNEVTGLGGGKQAAKTSYDKLVKSLGDQWESKPAAQLKVSAQQAADKINIQANVSDLKKPGESVRLHVVVVEEVVHFAGNNGQRLHHHVVRAFPGGVKGIALKEASAKQDVSVSIADLRKSLDQYLSDDAHKFDEDNRPLDLKHLKVVAFIQDEATKEVLQAAQADLNESKSETE